MAIVELYAVDLFLDPSLSMHEPFVTALSCLVVIGLAGSVSDLGSASVSRSFAARGA